MSVHELAPGKINLCLFLGPLRADRRHELVTVYESLSLADELVISESSTDEVVAPGVEGPNLVSRALVGLRGLGWEAPPLRVEIQKRIPVAGGMGGGSADAAAILRVASRWAPVDEGWVAEVAAELGADVPAQLKPGVSLGTGAGEIVTRQPALPEHAVVIVPLEAQLATPAVYAEADRLGLPREPEELADALSELKRVLELGIRLRDGLMVNDLEPAARSLCPAVAGAIDAVEIAAADRAMVCGSGPTVAGIFWGSGAAARAGEAAARLAERYPGTIAAVPISSSA